METRELREIIDHLERVATQARDENVIVPLKNGHYLGIRFDHLREVLAGVGRLQDLVRDSLSVLHNDAAGEEYYIRATDALDGQPGDPMMMEA